MKVTLIRCTVPSLIASVLSGLTAAQTAWPERSIQLIVPFPAGGGVDVIARPREKVVADERFQRATRQANQEPLYRNSADFGRALAADFAIKGDVVKRAGIKGQ